LALALDFDFRTSGSAFLSLPAGSEVVEVVEVSRAVLLIVEKLRSSHC
jgi:hypothetical protein